MLAGKSTVIPGPSLRLRVRLRHGIVLLGSVLALSCNRAPEVWHGERRFDELLRAPNASSVSTAGGAWVTIDNESRAVIVRPVTVVHAEGLRVEQPGSRTYRAPALDGISAPLPVVAAMVRPAGGEWQPRSVSIADPETARTLTIAFTAADTTQPLDLAATAWLPPLPLDVSSDAFRMPGHARLRFGTAVRAAMPVEAHFRVSIQPDAGKSEVLSDAIVDSTSTTAGWHDLEVDVTRYAGQQVRLRFEANLGSRMPLGEAPFPPPRAVVSAPLLVAPQAAREPAYNLILVSIDTLRADHVGAYGYRRPISPTIDRLAAGGTLFEHVFAVWPETSASHMTLFTSLYPSVHGIGIMKWGAAVLPAGQLTLSEWLRQQGFTTAAITEDGLLSATAGFSRGFDQYRELPPNYTTGQELDRNPIDGLPMARRRLGSVEEGVGYATSWLRQHRDDRFFLFLHTYQVHQRSAPGERYAALREQFVTDGFAPAIPKADSFLATYDAAIAYTDAHLDDLLRTLDELDLRARTLVVVTSDHGEEFYEHGVFGHGTSLYDPALHVPLVFNCPGLVPAGKRVDTQISLIDLLPTIFELLHQPPLPQAQGRSAASLVTGQEAAERPPIVCELGDDWRALRTRRSKLMRVREAQGTRLESYDLEHDPGETRALRSEEGGDVTEGLRILDEHDLDCTAVRIQLGASAPGAARTAAKLDEQTRERLRALGYEVPAKR